MRFPVLALVLFVSPTLATAGPTGGGGGGNGGGGGRLGDVSGGLREPRGPRGPGGGGNGGGGTRDPRPGNGTDRIVYAPLVAAVPVVVIDDLGIARRVKPAPPDAGGTAKIEAYAGAQRVHESQGAWHVELGVRDRLFALRASVTRYYEEQSDGSNLTLTMPALIGGVRVDDHRGPTRVYFELGAVVAKTRNDPVADTTRNGGLAGIRLEHRMTREASLIGEVHEMVFQESVRAHSARVGFRYNVLQASLRVLDFNVGPALYGPELGLTF